MRVELKNKRFYVNLPNRLFIELKEYNRVRDGMDLDLAVLILYFITKEQSEAQEWVPLSSEILRKYDHGHYKSSEQVELLKEGGFIEYLNHQNNIPGKENSCRRFRISLKYFEQEKDASTPYIHTYEIQQRPLLKKLEKHNAHRKIEAISSTPHLTKWLDCDGFTIETEAALEHCREKYYHLPESYRKRGQIIKNFNPSQSYSRDGKDDRLHSIFTQLPTDLKKFVKYKGQQFIEVDTQNSQPLMFALLLEKFMAHYKELKVLRYGVTEGRLRNRILNTLKHWVNNNKNGYYYNNKYVIDIDKISNSITIILLETFESLDFTAIEEFISLVKQGSIYEYLGESFLSMGLIYKKGQKFYARLYNKIEGIQEDKGFASLRKCAKTVMINALYAPKESKVPIIRAVKDHFSSVFKIVDAFKVGSYKDFSLTLQRIEAKCVIDHCAKNIAKKYPDMPLICRHDSLSTTEEFGGALFDEFKKQIDSYFGTAVKLEKKNW